MEIEEYITEFALDNSEAFIQEYENIYERGDWHVFTHPATYFTVTSDDKSTITLINLYQDNNGEHSWLELTPLLYRGGTGVQALYFAETIKHPDETDLMLFRNIASNYQNTIYDTWKNNTSSKKMQLTCQTYNDNNYKITNWEEKSLEELDSNDLAETLQDIYSLGKQYVNIKSSKNFSMVKEAFDQISIEYENKIKAAEEKFGEEKNHIDRWINILI